MALAGLIGAGRSELAHALAGDAPARSGTITLNGERLALRSPRDAIAAGLGLAPEERKAQALFLHRSIRDNTALVSYARLRRKRFVGRARERSLAQEFADRLRVRAPSIEAEVRTLSGGNQQKVVLARWLARRPELLTLDEPTRGVDIGAKAEIYQIIADLARDGVAVLVISSAPPEVLGLADRVVVRNGRVTRELPRAEASEAAVLALAMADDPRSRFCRERRPRNQSRHHRPPDRSPMMSTATTPSARPAPGPPATDSTNRPGGARAVLASVVGQNPSLMGALVLVVVLFTSLNTNFLSWDNMRVIGEAATIAGLLAVVQTVVIICGGLDISVGSQSGLASVVSATVFTSAGSSAPLGIAAHVLLTYTDIGRNIHALGGNPRRHGLIRRRGRARVRRGSASADAGRPPRRRRPGVSGHRGTKARRASGPPCDSPPTQAEKGMGRVWASAKRQTRSPRR